MQRPQVADTARITVDEGTRSYVTLKEMTIGFLQTGTIDSVENSTEITNDIWGITAIIRANNGKRTVTDCRDTDDYMGIVRGASVIKVYL